MCAIGASTGSSKLIRSIWSLSELGKLKNAASAIEDQHATAAMPIVARALAD
jgi:hypothetical protein